MGLMQHAAPVLAMMCCIVGCSRSLSLDGKQCPCVSGWVCDQTTNTCVRSIDASSDVVTDATDTLFLPDVDISNRKRVFVSSGKYAGDLGGIEAATGICAELANEADLGGDWVAFISAPSDKAIDRLNESGPWYLVNGLTLVAANKAQLIASDFTQQLEHAINMTEEGLTLSCNVSDTPALYSECGVWTGTYTDGEVHPNQCEGWTTSSNEAEGHLGVAHFPDANWLGTGAFASCNALRRIYCFEQ